MHEEKKQERRRHGPVKPCLTNIFCRITGSWSGMETQTEKHKQHKMETGWFRGICTHQHYTYVDADVVHVFLALRGEWSLNMKAIMWEFPKIRGTILGAPIIRARIFWGLYWGPLIWGNYHVIGECIGIGATI